MSHITFLPCWDSVHVQEEHSTWHFRSWLEPLERFPVSDRSAPSVCLFVVWQTPRKPVVERHSLILLLPLWHKPFNLDFYHTKQHLHQTVPWWFAFMLQSVSFSEPTGTSPRVALQHQTLESHCSHFAFAVPRHSFYPGWRNKWDVMRQNHPIHMLTLTRAALYEANELNTQKQLTELKIWIARWYVKWKMSFGELSVVFLSQTKKSDTWFPL